MQLVVECQSVADIKVDMSTFEDILDSKLASDTLIDDVEVSKSNGNKENIFEENCAIINGNVPEIIVDDKMDASENKRNIVPQNEEVNTDSDVKIVENHNELSEFNACHNLVKEEEQEEEIKEEIDKILEEKLKILQCENDIILRKDAEIATENPVKKESPENETDIEISKTSDNLTNIAKLKPTSEECIQVETNKNDECIQEISLKPKCTELKIAPNNLDAKSINNINDDIAVVTSDEQETLINEKNQTIEVIDVDDGKNVALDEIIIKDDANDEAEVMEVEDPEDESVMKSTEEKVKDNSENINSSDTMIVEDTVVEKLPESPATNIIDLDDIADSTSCTETVNKSEPTQIQKEPQKKISRLSNNLDILSDDEEESASITPVCVEPVPEVTKNEDLITKHSITEDDNDIVLIEDTKDIVDEETPIDEDLTNVPKDESVEVTEDNSEKKTNFMESIELSCNKAVKDNENEKSDLDETLKVKKLETLLRQPKETKTEEIPNKPLVPIDFLKTSKKSLTSMTRGELEEFCILKIVESVVDRVNLADTQSKLRNLAQKLDENEKKIKVFAKQNRDLQLVLKSIQEEQKKKFSNSQPITPLKITRSVGIQVLMPDKTSPTRKKGPQSPNVVPPLSVIRTRNQSQGVQRASPQPKCQQNSENIPVPRLIPANNVTKNNPKSPSPSCSNKTPVSPVNGLRNSTPTLKTEKRPLNKDQLSIDLTDDEPPSKVVARNPQPPVRLVPPQNLMGPQRSPFGQALNSPRKVFIPISSTNGQVRATQAVMVKQHASTVQRQRPIAPNIRVQNPVKNRSNLVQRHPAPLPDIMKQYHPPNWKALPPAPDLKLSKVDNGIVISWKINGYQEEDHEEIASYQLYAYQETAAPPSTALWKKIGDVKALPLPMACTLTQFTAGNSYYFAVRAVDVKSRLGPFSEPGSILLPHKM